MISVIIIAYTRKEFLLDAIKSAINQTLSKDKYEIIVIKNYKDEVIDEFIDNNNIENILSNNNSLSGKIYEALKLSKGNIISFLEDDDLFFNNKLEYIYNLFKNNNNLVYYHNSYMAIKENKEKAQHNNPSYHFNTSCISIKKSIINLEKLKNFESGLDTFMYLSALESKGKLLHNNEKLNFYRVHNSTSNYLNPDFNSYLDWSIKFGISQLNAYINMSHDFVNSKPAIKHIHAHITGEKINLLLISNDKRYKVSILMLINFLLNSDPPLNYNIKMLMVYISIYIPQFRLYILSKVKKSYLNFINSNL